MSLIGFGLDSGIEVAAALILAWRLAQERRTGCKQDADKRAQRLIALSFAALALYVGIATGRDRPHREPGSEGHGRCRAPRTKRRWTRSHLLRV